MAGGRRLPAARGNDDWPRYRLQYCELLTAAVLCGRAYHLYYWTGTRFTRRGYVITIENGTLLVSLIGRFGDFPPIDKEGFLAFARELHSDLAYRIIRDGEQLCPIANHRFASSVQRHYERMTAFPRGFLVVGDALCTFNPIYAQGMSAAAKQGDMPHRVLSQCAAGSASLDELAPAFFARAAEANGTPWNLAAAFDFAFPQTSGIRPPDIEQRARYSAALDRLQSEDTEVRRLVMELSAPAAFVGAAAGAVT
jgi:2-polyprenyl-6-methoxyphenol hydroxylase-like FAD-dependent oxidoreductase